MPFIAAIAVQCFTALTQVVDVTSYLPQIVVTELQHAGQSVACLPVRQSGDTAFYPVAHECLTEDGLVSIVPVPFFASLSLHTPLDRIALRSRQKTCRRGWLIVLLSEGSFIMAVDGSRVALLKS